MMSYSFYDLTPHAVLDAVEELGMQPTGELLQLNSYENRVFAVTLEKNSGINFDKVIVKFYRPGRWTQASIRNEHGFLGELRSEDFPVAAPLAFDRQTLFNVMGLWMAVFPQVRGRMPDELLLPDYHSVGQRLAQLHLIGGSKKASHRLSLTVEEVGWPVFDVVRQQVAPEVKHRYLQAAESILDFLEAHLEPRSFLRIHGDCHRGNLLHDGKQFYFVDFDDFCNGPEAQDLWLLLSAAGPDGDQERQALLSGYRELRELDERQLLLFEPLRGLRIIYYASWIINRWQDPSFPRLFPEFGSYRYWAEETEALEKIAWGLQE